MAEASNDVPALDPEAKLADQPGWSLDDPIHFPRWMGIELTVLEPGRVEGQLLSRPEIMNYRGVFHGGAVSTLADVSMISAVKTRAPEGSLPVTAGLQVNFLAAGRGHLTSEARVVRIGGGLGFAVVTVSDASRRPVASGSGVFRILVSRVDE